jgi:hypothetical protein
MICKHYSGPCPLGTMSVPPAQVSTIFQNYASLRVLLDIVSMPSFEQTLSS